ncbi:amidohydrolase [Kocuria sp. cx-116]|uniref:amidohydrolase n=1 Tax=Kocuria sp. cx-116 TaxID=2771378 RepID=UPI001687C8B7|nr:amidohydrolase [Kocuria sp. cx-116]MBD2763189.1 amidohydrolase [Kocuria sp. cx-116]
MECPIRSLTIINAVVYDPGSAYETAPRGVVVREGVITFVGSSEQARERSAPNAPVIDAGGRFLMPGLIESHGHPGMYAKSLLQVDCRPAVTPTVEDIVSAISRQAEHTEPGEWLAGWGYDEHRMKGPGPTVQDLDRAAPEHPVFLRRTCAHMALVNTAALERVGISDDTPDPSGGCIVRDPDTGRATGLLQEKAMSLVDLPTDTPEGMTAGMRLALNDLAGKGITTVHDMSSGPIEMGVYQSLLAHGALTVRFRPWYFALAQGEFPGSYDAVLGTGLRSGFGNDMLRYQGLKFVLDGSVGGRTAALAEPFEGGSSRGILYYDSSEIEPLVTKAVAAGQRVAVHGIGERAVTQALDLIEAGGRDAAGGVRGSGSEETAAQEHYDALVRSRRHRVEHCGLPHQDELDRLRDGNIIAAASTAFLYELGDSYLNNLGPERIARTYPMRTFIDHGIQAPINSDFPVTTPNPWLGIYAAVARRTSSGRLLDTVENISVAEAIAAFTTVAARASFEEDRLGRIAEGFLGDLVLMDRDPFCVETEDLKDLRPVLTVCDGRVVYREEAENNR